LHDNFVTSGSHVEKLKIAGPTRKDGSHRRAGERAKLDADALDLGVVIGIHHLASNGIYAGGRGSHAWSGSRWRAGAFLGKDRRAEKRYDAEQDRGWEGTKLQQLAQFSPPNKCRKFTLGQVPVQSNTGRTEQTEAEPSSLAKKLEVHFTEYNLVARGSASAYDAFIPCCFCFDVSLSMTLPEKV
jgi:hypothetical protein